jgi:hypothetical protein
MCPYFREFKCTYVNAWDVKWSCAMVYISDVSFGRGFMVYYSCKFAHAGQDYAHLLSLSSVA